MSNILVLAPHPDDESIGCGGTLRKHVVEGDSVRVIFVTSGERGGHGRSPEQTRIVRELEARKAAAILGLDRIEFWKERNGHFRVTTKLISRLRTILQHWRPSVIYVTHDREMHPEHRAAARLVRRAVSQSRTARVKSRVLMYEVWTPVQEIDHIVDISPYLDIKLAAIRAHKSQCDVVGFDEAARGLNRYRGELHSWPGGDYAEVFREMRI